jgi:hypothetical protein
VLPPLPPLVEPEASSILTFTVSAVGVYGTTTTVKVWVPSKTGIEVISGSALLADCV